MNLDMKTVGELLEHEDTCTHTTVKMATEALHLSPEDPLTPDVLQKIRLKIDSLQKGHAFKALSMFMKAFRGPEEDAPKRTKEYIESINAKG